MRALSFLATTFILAFILVVIVSCSGQKDNRLSSLPSVIRDQVEEALSVVQFSDTDRNRVRDAINNDPAGFAVLFSEVREIMKNDTDLLCRVDKQKALSAQYVPIDLVDLDGPFPYIVSKKGMKLRKPAQEALVRMAEMAKKDGIALVVSSAYRSYDYQKIVFEQNVNEMGRAEAERVSAVPGMSQHQLGTVVDFGSISDEFAGSDAERWLASNAGKFGFSLSFPKDMENITGYKWESWHYRYISPPAVELQERFFLGIQQYLIEFLAALPN
ncbi:MAG TPA: M15 family metallopeptidase [Rectinema sp.]|jgi:D-alanyl-D-alanine carboxypeptidase|nr:M15 family metallopeptidase [Rectinema sp.]HQG15461.1 M15 family metallopeptidase [Rectinema sp.]HQH88493.1 M15 family metallopeptidase [Rectinema sp.]HQN02732.1 M15 family metallopeptidase [Rectinema sp.]